MPETKQGYNMPGASSQGDDMDISPEIVKKLLRQIPDGPLKYVEEIFLPEPWSPSPLRHSSRYTKGKRGPKSIGDWHIQVRKDWGNLDDADKLGRSWLAYLPQVQKLAVSKYGGGLPGRGMALKQLLTQALIEARQYETDEKTHAMLIKYPEVTIEAIAKECGITREQFSRQYCPKAVTILTECFQHLIGRRSKSRVYQKSV